MKELEIDKVIEQDKLENELSEEESKYIANKLESEKDEEEESIDEEDKSSEEDLDLKDEKIEDDSSYSDVSVESFNETKDFVIDSTKYLGMIGLQVTPKIFNSLYKGIIYLMIKLVRLLSFSISKLSKMITRQFSNFDRMEKDLIYTRKNIELIKKKTEEPLDLSTKLYTNKKVIDKIKIHDKVELLNNVKVLSAFVNEIIVNLDDRILKELHLLEYISSIAGKGIVKQPLDEMKVNKLSTNFTINVPAEYKSDIENTISYSYKSKLPGDILFITRLPTPAMRNLDSIVNAYTSSEMFFGIDTRNYQDINSINYMSLEELSSLVNELDNLCKLCLSHEQKFRNILSKNNSLKYNYKTYFSLLINSDKKVSIKDSLIQYYYLKYSFIDKVYISGCDSIYDYVISVITNVKEYIDDNLDQHSNNS